MRKLINILVATNLLTGCMSTEKFARLVGGEVIYNKKEIKNHDPNNNGIPELVGIYLGDTLTASYTDKNQDGIPDEIFFGSDYSTPYFPSDKTNPDYKDNLGKKPITDVIGFGPKENGDYAIIGLYTKKEGKHVLKWGWYNLNSDNKPSSFFWGEDYNKEYLIKED